MYLNRCSVNGCEYKKYQTKFTPTPRYLHPMATAALSLPPDEPPASPPPPSTYSDAFWRALLTLRDHGVSEDLAVRALQTWVVLAHAGAPEAGIEQPEGALRFTWSFADVYLHLDVRADGYEWFYMVSATDESASEGLDTPVTALSPAFFARLKELRARHPT